MKCNKVKQFLSAYLDDELTGLERQTVMQHLSTCAKCSQELVTLRTVSNLVGSLPKLHAPDGLAEEVSHQLARHLQSQPVPAESPWIRFLFRYRPALIGVASAAAVFLIVYVNIIFLAKPSYRETSLSRGNAGTPVTITPKTPPSFGKEPLAPGKARNDETALSRDQGEKTQKENEDYDNLRTEPKKPNAAPKQHENPEIGFVPKTESAGNAKDYFGSKLKKDNTQKKGRAEDALSAERNEQNIDAEPISTITMLSQDVLIVCADIEPQLSKLEHAVNDTLSQILRTQYTGTRNKLLQEQVMPPSGEQIHKQQRQLAGDIKSFRSQEQKFQGRRQFQAKIIVPVEAKEELLGKLGKLGRVKVSELKMLSPTKPQHLAQIDQLTERLVENEKEISAEPILNDEKVKQSTKGAVAGQKTAPKAPSFVIEGREKDKESTEEIAQNKLAEIEKQLIKKYDLETQQIVQKNMLAGRVGRGDLDAGLKKAQPTKPEDMRTGNTILQDEAPKAEEQLSKSLPYEPVMVELVITLEEKYYETK